MSGRSCSRAPRRPPVPSELIPKTRPEEGGQPVGHGVGQAPERGPPAEEELVDPLAPSIESRMDELAEVINDACLGPGSAEGGVEGPGDGVVPGAITGREDQNAWAKSAHR